MSKELAKKIIQEGVEHSYLDKGNVLIVDSEATKEEKRNCAAQIFKALRGVKALQGKKYTITLEVEEPIEEPTSSENPPASPSEE